MKLSLFRTYLVVLIAFAGVSSFISCNKEEKHSPSTVTIETSGITAKSVTVTINPNEHTANYMFAVGKESDLEAFKNGTLQGIVKVDGNKSDTRTFDELDPLMNYTVFAVGVNAGNQKGEVVTKEVITVALPLASVTVEELPNSLTSITVKLVPDENTASFKFALGSENDKEAFINGSLEGIITVEGKEEREHTFENLEGQTEYTLFANATNSAGDTGKTLTKTVSTANYPLGTVTIKEEVVTANSISVVFTPDANTASYKIAIGTKEDRAKFEDGTLEGIETISEKEEYPKTFSGLEFLKEYTVFAQALNIKDIPGEVTELKATPEVDYPHVGVFIKDINTMYCITTSIPNDQVSSYYILTAGKNVYFEFVELYESFGISEEEFIQMLGLSADERATNVFALSGQPRFDQMFVIAVYDSNGDLHDIIYEDFKTPALEPGLPLPEDVTIAVGNITDKSAVIKFTPGANTAGYYELVMTEEGYNAIAENPEYDDEKKFQEFRSNFLLGENMMIDEDEDTWSLSKPGTGYVAMALPFNNNGEAGWGDISIHKFTSAGTAPSSPEMSISSKTGNREVIPSLTREKLQQIKKERN